MVTPVGLSYAQTVDTANTAKINSDDLKEQMEQEKRDRLEAQKQMAAEIKAMMNVKKEAAARVRCSH